MKDRTWEGLHSGLRGTGWAAVMGRDQREEFCLLRTQCDASKANT